MRRCGWERNDTLRMMDFSSWQGILTTLIGLTLITVIGVGIRLVIMMRVQEKRQRANRQINERVKTLMAAYKTLGGSFTGDLAVDPAHLRDLRQSSAEEPERAVDLSPERLGSDRSRRIRDAVEAALADVLVRRRDRSLGPIEQVFHICGNACGQQQLLEHNCRY